MRGRKCCGAAIGLFRLLPLRQEPALAKQPHREKRKQRWEAQLGVVHGAEPQAPLLRTNSIGKLRADPKSSQLCADCPMPIHCRARARSLRGSIWLSSRALSLWARSPQFCSTAVPTARSHHCVHNYYTHGRHAGQLHWHSTAHPKQRAGRESRPIDRRAEEERSHVTSLTFAWPSCVPSAPRAP